MTNAEYAIREAIKCINDLKHEKERLETKLEKQKRETAREILQKLYNETEYFSFQYIIKELAAEYGVEVEE